VRFEYKYIVPVSIIEMLRETIHPFLEVDRFAVCGLNNQYTVRSVYFDTPRFDYYFEKIEGVKNRKKVRIRGYTSNESNETVFLEIKRKYDVPILKHRAPILFSQIDDLLAGKISTKMEHTMANSDSGRNMNRFLYQVYSKNLRPVVLVIDEREAYLSKFDPNVRVTFDKNLRGSAYPSVGGLFIDEQLKQAMERFFILEVKFNRHFPGWLKPVLAKYGLKKQAASKYVKCMDTCGIPGQVRKSTLYTNSNWIN